MAIRIFLRSCNKYLIILTCIVFMIILSRSLRNKFSSSQNSPLLKSRGSNLNQAKWDSAQIEIPKHTSFINHSSNSINDSNNVTFAPLCNHKQRISAIKSMCKKLHLIHGGKHRNPGLVVQPEYKVGYCEISKIGSTNMKRVFATSTQKGKNLPKDFKENWHNSKFLKKMGITGDKGLNSKISNLIKFFIIRHPLDRLISAYNSKLGPYSPGNGIYGKLGKRIIKVNNPDTSEKELAKRNRATFPEFIHALTTKKINLRDNHWIPFATFCNPCQVDYDFVLRLESMTHDSAPIMKILKVSETHVEQTNYESNKRLRYKNPAVIKNNTAYAVLKRLDPYKDVPREDIKILMQMYDLDLKLYGYTFDENSLLQGCQFKGEQCC